MPISEDFAQLNPDRVLDAIEAMGLRPDGRLLALNSFENRVYQIGLEESTPVVAKFYRPERWTDAQILEEHAFASLLAEADIPVVPPLSLGGQTLHHVGNHRLAVFPRQGGREPVLESEDNLAWLGRVLGRIHAMGADHPFEHRLQLLDSDRVEAAAQALIELGFMPTALESRYRQIADALCQRIAEAYGETWICHAIHGDCHRGNVLWTDSGPHFVDLDDCVTGPAVADFWMLLDAEPETRRQQLAALLEGYEQFMDFNPRQLRLIEPLRAARMIEYAAWIARRWDDPAFPAAFPWFGEDRYFEEHLAGLEDQLRRMEAA